MHKAPSGDATSWPCSARIDDGTLASDCPVRASLMSTTPLSCRRATREPSGSTCATLCGEGHVRAAPVVDGKPLSGGTADFVLTAR